jgi:transcriptional regulator with XRE-family HTH domain
MNKRANIETQLRQAILSAKLSRYAISKLSGVSQAVLSRFVTGGRTLTLETAAKLADALGLELSPRRKARKAGSK